MNNQTHRMSKTALIILNYNNCADTRNCVDSVLTHNTAPVKFVFVDNASRDNERVALQEFLANKFGDSLAVIESTDAKSLESCARADCEAVLVLNSTNSGYASGNNLGLAVAYADDEVADVMILNNDIIFVDDIIPALLKRRDSIADCAIIAPVLYKAGLKDYDYNCARDNETVGQMIKTNILHYWRRLRGISDADANCKRYRLKSAVDNVATMPIELPSGSCMLVSKDLFRRIGSFDPSTFLYYEENILFKKIENLRKVNYLCLDLKCVHLGAATTSALPKSYILIKAAIDSQKHYVKNYSGASAALRCLHSFSCAFFLTSFRLQKALAKHKK